VNKDVPVDYAHPPVVETILGIQFEPLRDFSNAHGGLFWAELGDRWPSVNDAAPLEPQFEHLAETAKWVSPSFALRVAENLPSRLMIRNKANDRLIQLQNGRLHLNWLGHEGADYPRFESMLEELRGVEAHFAAFVKERNLGELRPNQWEVSYLNHIPRETVWKDVGDWGFFKPLESVAHTQARVKLETFHGEWHFIIPPNYGRLHVEWRHGKATKSSEELIALNLTARGPIRVAEDGPGVKLAWEGLRIGHDAIVFSFRDFMSEAANAYWGIKR
jgi:hypothetical protein